MREALLALEEAILSSHTLAGKTGPGSMQTLKRSRRAQQLCWTLQTTCAVADADGAVTAAAGTAAAAAGGFGDRLAGGVYSKCAQSARHTLERGRAPTSRNARQAPEHAFSRQLASVAIGLNSKKGQMLNEASKASPNMMDKDTAAKLMAKNWTNQTESNNTSVLDKNTVMFVRSEESIKKTGST